MYFHEKVEKGKHRFALFGPAAKEPAFLLSEGGFIFGHPGLEFAAEAGSEGGGSIGRKLKVRSRVQEVFMESHFDVPVAFDNGRSKIFVAGNNKHVLLGSCEGKGVALRGKEVVLGAPLGIQGA